MIRTTPDIYVRSSKSFKGHHVLHSMHLQGCGDKCCDGLQCLLL